MGDESSKENLDEDTYDQSSAENDNSHDIRSIDEGRKVPSQIHFGGMNWTKIVSKYEIQDQEEQDSMWRRDEIERYHYVLEQISSSSEIMVQVHTKNGRIHGGVNHEKSLLVPSVFCENFDPKIVSLYQHTESKESFSGPNIQHSIRTIDEEYEEYLEQLKLTTGLIKIYVSVHRRRIRDLLSDSVVSGIISSTSMIFPGLGAVNLISEHLCGTLTKNMGKETHQTDPFLKEIPSACVFVQVFENYAERFGLIIRKIAELELKSQRFRSFLEESNEQVKSKITEMKLNTNRYFDHRQKLDMFFFAQQPFKLLQITASFIRVYRSRSEQENRQIFDLESDMMQQGVENHRNVEPVMKRVQNLIEVGRYLSSSKKAKVQQKMDILGILSRWPPISGVFQKITLRHTRTRIGENHMDDDTKKEVVSNDKRIDLILCNNYLFFVDRKNEEDDDIMLNVKDENFWIYRQEDEERSDTYDWMMIYSRMKECKTSIVYQNHYLLCFDNFREKQLLANLLLESRFSKDSKSTVYKIIR